jgi:hypothetical protein
MLFHTRKYQGRSSTKDDLKKEEKEMFFMSYNKIRVGINKYKVHNKAHYFKKLILYVEIFF